MIKISEKHIEEYQKLSKELLGKDVSRKEALEQALKLVNLFEALLKNKNKSNSLKGKT